MRDLKDLKYAFDQADAGFAHNIYRTLAELQKNKNKRPAARISLRLAAVIAVVIVLSAGTALAVTNTWGILDFLSGRSENAKVLPEASKIVQTDVPQKGGETELASFSVREAAFDGHNYYIIVDVKPSNPKYLLLGPDAYPQDPVGNMGPLFSSKTGTIADYAKAQEQTIIQTNVGVDGVNGGGADFLLQQDGTLTYMLSGDLTEKTNALKDNAIDNSGKKANLALYCIVTRFENQSGKDVPQNVSRSSLNVTLENTGIRELISSLAPAVYADCGARIDSITLKASELAVYAEISYTVVDQAKFDATDTGLCFEFLGADGKRLPDGAAVGGGTSTKDNVHFVQASSLGAMKTLPREITVRAFNCWEKNKYETHVFEMK